MAWEAWSKLAKVPAHAPGGDLGRAALFQLLFPYFSLAASPLAWKLASGTHTPTRWFYETSGVRREGCIGQPAAAAAAHRHARDSNAAARHATDHAILARAAH